MTNNEQNANFVANSDPLELERQDALARRWRASELFGPSDWDEELDNELLDDEDDE